MLRAAPVLEGVEDRSRQQLELLPTRGAFARRPQSDQNRPVGARGPLLSRVRG